MAKPKKLDAEGYEVVKGEIRKKPGTFRYEITGDYISRGVGFELHFGFSYPKPSKDPSSIDHDVSLLSKKNGSLFK